MAIRWPSGGSAFSPLESSGSFVGSACTNAVVFGLVAGGGSAQAAFYASASANNQVWSLRVPANGYAGQELGRLLASPCGWYVELTGTGSALVYYTRTD